MKANELKENSGFIVTPFSGLNVVLGGGIPLGKITECAGSWSVGKSTLAYQTIGAAQKQDRECLLLDAERAYSTAYGSSLGINNETLELFRAKTAEEYLDKAIEWMKVKKNRGGLCVIDAIGSLLPREEAEATSEKRTIGLQSRLIGAFCRRVVPVLDDNNIALLILNHTFVPIGLNSVASSGGKKLEYSRSVWLILSGAYGEPIKKDSTGLKTVIPMRLEVKKNKIVPNMGTKIDLSLIQGAGFIGDTVSAPIIRKGRPKNSLITS